MSTQPESATSQFAASLSTLAETEEAIQEAAAEIQSQLEGTADLVACFVSHHHAEHWEAVAPALTRALQPQALIGCSGEAIAATSCEIEDQPAVALWAARLPQASLTPMRLEFQQTAEGGVIVGWPDSLSSHWPEDATLLLLGEPFSFPADYLLERLNEDQPGVPIVGGMASGAQAPGENRLFLDQATYATGAVGILLSGVGVTPLVSQGCRPIGQPFVITRAEQNVIYELGGESAISRLRHLYNTLPTSEQLLVQRGLHVGRVVNEYQDRFDAGDFLVRNVIGVDQDSGAIALGDFVRTGQTVQFHIRDERSADEDLNSLLVRYGNSRPSPPRGALLFTCNGRGTRLFSRPHHDAQAVREVLGDLPLAGFFAQGEFGPVGGKNFMHGFTASLAVFH